jgi:hypothetical protein
MNMRAREGVGRSDDTSARQVGVLEHGRILVARRGVPEYSCSWLVPQFADTCSSVLC